MVSQLFGKKINSPCIILILFCLSIFISIIFISLITNYKTCAFPATDYKEFYYPVAKNIYEGKGITLKDGDIYTIVPPGYSIILTCLIWITDNIDIQIDKVIISYSILVMALIAILLLFISNTIWRNNSAIIPSLLWVTCPFALIFINIPYSELSFILLFYLAFYIFWRLIMNERFNFWGYFFSGVLFGLSMLIKPVAIGIVVIMAATTLFFKMNHKIRLAIIGSLLLGNLLAVLPWEILVYSKTKNIIVLSSCGKQRIINGLAFGLYDNQIRGKVPEAVNILQKKIYAISSESPWLSPKFDDSFNEITLLLKNEILSRPMVIANLLYIKAMRSWYATDSGRYEDKTRIIQAIYLTLITISGFFAWRLKGKPRLLLVTIGAITLYFWSMTILVLSIVRYMLPTMGLLFLLIPCLFEPTIKKN